MEKDPQLNILPSSKSPDIDPMVLDDIKRFCLDEESPEDMDFLKATTPEQVRGTGKIDYSQDAFEAGQIGKS